VKKKVVGIGAGGHAKVIVDILRKYKEYEILGLLDIEGLRKGETVLDVPILGGQSKLQDLFLKNVKHVFMAFASLGDLEKNKKMFDNTINLGFEVINIFHSTAIISDSVITGTGNRIFAGAIINPGTVVGDNVVINTGAIVDHDCRIGNHTQIAPGAKLAGSVIVGEGSLVGIGATIIQGIKIGKNSKIGAGAVVIKDVADNVTVGGIPAKKLSSSI